MIITDFVIRGSRVRLVLVRYTLSVTGSASRHINVWLRVCLNYAVFFLNASVEIHSSNEKD